MHSGYRIVRAAAVVLLFCAPASIVFASSSYTQRKVSSGKFPIHTACMMPAQGQLTRITVKGAEGMTSESENWTRALEAVVDSHLRSDGIVITPASAVLDSGASEDEVNQAVLGIEEKYVAIAPRLDKKPGDIAKSAYTLSDQVALLPCSAKSDVLVFIQAAGQVLSDGRTAMTFLIGGPAEGAVLLVTMADAKTGEILGLIRIRTDDEFVTNVDGAFGESLDNELSNMNVGSARKKAQGKKP